MSKKKFSKYLKGPITEDVWIGAVNDSIAYGQGVMKIEWDKKADKIKVTQINPYKKQGSKMKQHKMTRKLKSKSEYQLCTGKRAEYSEHLRYFWRDVTCPKCLKMRK